MPRENVVTAVAARLLNIPFRLLARRPFTPPQKVLILQPCCISQVLLTTPLLTILQQAHPGVRFDWAVSEWARPAIHSHPGITQFISTGAGSLRDASWAELAALRRRIAAEGYDTCFIPSRSTYLAVLAWMAGIPQRVGLNLYGRGFAHTISVSAPPGETHAARYYLALASAVGIETAKLSRPPLTFHPGDAARKKITEHLVSANLVPVTSPLIVIHPGGGEGSGWLNAQKQWPVARFVRLCNQLHSRFQAKIILVGDARDKGIAREIQGLCAVPLHDWSGQLSLAELGALAEIVDLYIGNDTGPTHVAAAVGCRTIAIFGPSDPRFSAPYSNDSERVKVLWREEAVQGARFNWEAGVQVADVVRAAAAILR
jgi:lipopolysaccharide heptosyltransferase II